MEFDKMLPSIEDVSHCPICNSHNNFLWSHAKDLQSQLTDQSFIYSKCKNCYVLFISRRPIESDIGFFYRSNYYPYQYGSSTQQKSKKGFLSRLKQTIRQRLSFVSPNLSLMKQLAIYYHADGVGLRFLDFGCGAGKHLNLLKRFKWNTIGVDFSPIAVETAIKNGHEAYIVSEFFQNNQSDLYYLIRMNHVVEHLYHPNEVLSGIARKMKEGAVLHIAVPNPSGISAKLFRRNWHGLDCPRHIILYPPKTIIKLLEDNGFSNCVVLQETITKDFLRSLGFLLAQYGILDLNKVPNLMNSKLLSAIFFLPIFLASKLGYGDRYHVFCDRK